MEEATGAMAASAENIEEEVGRVVEDVKELQDMVATHISKTSSEQQFHRQRALSLDSSIHRLRSLLDSLLSHKLLDPKLADKLDEDLQKAKCIIVDGDIASLLPGDVKGRFLRMFLGPINVRASQKDVQLKVKEEYNSYRV